MEGAGMSYGSSRGLDVCFLKVCKDLNILF